MGKERRLAFRSWVIWTLNDKALGGRDHMYQTLLDKHKKHQEHIVKRALLRISKATMAKSFSSWQAYTTERKQDKVKMLQSLARWTKRNLNQCFLAWATFVNSLCHQRRLLYKTIARIKYRAL